MRELLFGKEKPKRRRKIPKHIKNLVWNRYIGATKAEGKCYVCRRTIHIRRFEVGHNKAVAKGGSDNPDNLRPICRDCNLAMGTMSIEVFKRKYFSKTTKTARKPAKKMSTRTKTAQSYKCKIPLNSRILYCGKNKADKSCLSANIITGLKCSNLAISRKRRTTKKKTTTRRKT